MAERGAPLGNQNAAKAKVFGDALRKACVQEDFKRLREGVEQLLEQASCGERWALEMVRDTLDGKPKQQVEVAGEDGGPMAFEVIRRVVVRPDDSQS